LYYRHAPLFLKEFFVANGNHIGDRKIIIISKYNYVEIKKVRNLTWVVLLTVSVSSCKDSDKKEKRRKQKS
jgi:hypothetical protein